MAVHTVIDTVCYIRERDTHPAMCPRASPLRMLPLSFTSSTPNHTRPQQETSHPRNKKREAERALRTPRLHGRVFNTTVSKVSGSLSSSSSAFCLRFDRRSSEKVGCSGRDLAGEPSLRSLGGGAPNCGHPRRAPCTVPFPRAHQVSRPISTLSLPFTPSPPQNSETGAGTQVWYRLLELIRPAVRYLTYRIHTVSPPLAHR